MDLNEDNERVDGVDPDILFYEPSFWEHCLDNSVSDPTVDVPWIPETWTGYAEVASSPSPQPPPQPPPPPPTSLSPPEAVRIVYTYPHPSTGETCELDMQGLDVRDVLEVKYPFLTDCGIEVTSADIEWVPEDPLAHLSQCLASSPSPQPTPQPPPPPPTSLSPPEAVRIMYTYPHPNTGETCELDLQGLDVQDVLEVKYPFLTDCGIEVTSADIEWVPEDPLVHLSQYHPIGSANEGTEIEVTESPSTVDALEQFEYDVEIHDPHVGDEGESPGTTSTIPKITLDTILTLREESTVKFIENESGSWEFGLPQTTSSKWDNFEISAAATSKTLVTPNVPDALPLPPALVEKVQKDSLTDEWTMETPYCSLAEWEAPQDTLRKRKAVAMAEVATSRTIGTPVSSSKRRKASTTDATLRASGSPHTIFEKLEASAKETSAPLWTFGPSLLPGLGTAPESELASELAIQPAVDMWQTLTGSPILDLAPESGAVITYVAPDDCEDIRKNSTEDAWNAPAALSAGDGWKTIRSGSAFADLSSNALNAQCTLKIIPSQVSPWQQLSADPCEMPAPNPAASSYDTQVTQPKSFQSNIPHQQTEGAVFKTLATNFGRTENCQREIEQLFDTTYDWATYQKSTEKEWELGAIHDIFSVSHNGPQSSSNPEAQYHLAHSHKHSKEDMLAVSPTVPQSLTPSGEELDKLLKIVDQYELTEEVHLSGSASPERQTWQCSVENLCKPSEDVFETLESLDPHKLFDILFSDHHEPSKKLLELSDLPEIPDLADAPISSMGRVIKTDEGLCPVEDGLELWHPQILQEGSQNSGGNDNRLRALAEGVSMEMNKATKVAERCYSMPQQRKAMEYDEQATLNDLQDLITFPTRQLTCGLGADRKKLGKKSAKIKETKVSPQINHLKMSDKVGKPKLKKSKLNPTWPASNDAAKTRELLKSRPRKKKLIVHSSEVLEEKKAEACIPTTSSAPDDFDGRLGTFQLIAPKPPTKIGKSNTNSNNPIDMALSKYKPIAPKVKKTSPVKKVPTCLSTFNVDHEPSISEFENVKPADSEFENAKPADSELENAKPADTEFENPKPADTEPENPKPADTEPENPKLADSVPANLMPGNSEADKSKTLKLVTNTVNACPTCGHRKETPLTPDNTSTVSGPSTGAEESAPNVTAGLSAASEGLATENVASGGLASETAKGLPVTSGGLTLKTADGCTILAKGLTPETPHLSVSGTWEVLSIWQSKDPTAKSKDYIESGSKLLALPLADKAKKSLPKAASSDDIEHDIRPSCDICGRRLCTPFAVRRHMDAKHKEEMKKRAAAAKLLPATSKKVKQSQKFPKGLVMISQRDIANVQIDRADLSLRISLALAAKRKLIESSQVSEERIPPADNVTVRPQVGKAAQGQPPNQDSVYTDIMSEFLIFKERGPALDHPDMRLIDHQAGYISSDDELREIAFPVVDFSLLPPLDDSD